MENGQDKLIRDFKDLLAEAEAGEFGDFTNNKYAIPKMALAQKFHELRQKVINGVYD